MSPFQWTCPPDGFLSILASFSGAITSLDLSQHVSDSDLWHPEDYVRSFLTLRLIASIVLLVKWYSVSNLVLEFLFFVPHFRELSVISPFFEFFCHSLPNHDI